MRRGDQSKISKQSQAEDLLSQSGIRFSSSTFLSTLFSLFLFSTFLFYSEAQAQCLPNQWTAQDNVYFRNSKFDYKGASMSAYTSLPRREDVANVVYLHAFGDRAQNHRWLFNQFYNSKMRVISFDYPEHGNANHLKFMGWNLESLSEVIPYLFDPKASLNINPNLPVILVGWSMGGTLALKIGQDWKSRLFRGPLKDKLKSVIAIAPGIPNLQNRAPAGLDSMTACYDGIQSSLPTKSLQNFPAMMNSLTRASMQLFASPMASEIPSLVFMAQENDSIVNTSETLNWSFTKNAKNKNLKAIQCENSFHGLEFEPGDLGAEVRSNVVNFALASVHGKEFRPLTENCALIK